MKMKIEHHWSRRLFRLVFRNRFVIVRTEFHLEYCWHPKSTWSFGSLFYDCETFYYIHAGRLTVSLRGYPPYNEQSPSVDAIEKAKS